MCITALLLKKCSLIVLAYKNYIDLRICKRDILSYILSHKNNYIFLDIFHVNCNTFFQTRIAGTAKD